MIKNQKQAGITRDRLAELNQGLAELKTKESEMHPVKYKLGVDSFEGLIKELENQLQVYEGLVNNNIHVLQPNSLEDISDILISARLAQKMSQKELGEKVGIQEQQIQRYEQNDYETASWTRIMEIALALNLDIQFQKVIIVNNSVGEKMFDRPSNITPEEIERIISNVREKRTLITIV